MFLHSQRAVEIVSGTLSVGDVNLTIGGLRVKRRDNRFLGRATAGYGRLHGYCVALHCIAFERLAALEFPGQMKNFPVVLKRMVGRYPRIVSSTSLERPAVGSRICHPLGLRRSVAEASLEHCNFNLTCSHGGLRHDEGECALRERGEGL